MWTETTPNGKLRMIERYKDPLTLRYKRVSVTLDKDSPTARKNGLKALQSKIDALTGKYASDNITYNRLLELYLADHIDKVKASTYRRDSTYLHRMAEIIPGDSVINNLTTPYLNELMKKSGKKPITLNSYIKCLKPMLKWGYTNGLHTNQILIASLTSYKLDTSQKERIADKYLTSEEISLILAQMVDSEKWMQYYMTKFLILSGLRIGEAMALTDDDIKDGNIIVNKTYDVLNNTITSPKTLSSNRSVFIQKELAELIKHYKIYRNEYRYLKGIESNLFFSDQAGEYFRYTTYYQYLRDASERSIGRRITPHALRHTHASLLFEQGIPLDVVSRRLGHESSEVTKEVYVHITEKLKEKDNETIKDIRIC